MSSASAELKAQSSTVGTRDTSSSPLRDTGLLSPPLTDSGNGERFAKLHAQDVRYCPEYKQMAWLVWNGKRWRRDCDGRVHRMAKETARRLYTATLAIPDKVYTGMSGDE